MKRLLSVLFIFVILFFSPWVSAQQSQPPAQQQTPQKDNQENPKQKVSESFWQRTMDDPIALYTAILTAFTGVLALVSIVQGYFLYRAEKITKLSADAAKNVADAAMLNAETAQKQFLISGRQTDIQEKRKEISRLEFFATHRPHIIMRNASVIKENLESKILYTLVNTGGSDATITESWVITEVVSPVQPIRNLRCAGHNDLGAIELKAGEDRDFTHTVSEDNCFDLGFTDGENDRFYFTGSIRYHDPMGTMRTSVFRRRYKNGNFSRSDDQDHEYAD
jgi:hypothetical protein